MRTNIYFILAWILECYNYVCSFSVGKKHWTWYSSFPRRESLQHYPLQPWRWVTSWWRLLLGRERAGLEVERWSSRTTGVPARCRAFLRDTRLCSDILIIAAKGGWVFKGICWKTNDYFRRRTWEVRRKRSETIHRHDYFSSFKLGLDEPYHTLIPSRKLTYMTGHWTGTGYLY